jgi:CHAT domain-containing protein/Tfp pilus assembly protein PilF
VVEQLGIDVVVSILDPDGRPIAEVDRPSGLNGPESASLIAQSKGTYGIQIRSLEKRAMAGRYRLRLEEARAAAPRDESRILAERCVSEGESLRSAKTAESFRRGIEKFKEAISLWRTLDDEYEQAVALYGLGLCYRSTGDYQDAIDTFTTSLALMRGLGDEYGEAVSQTGLAWSYLYVGESEKALQQFSEALSIRQNFQDPRGEGFNLYGNGWAYALKGENVMALDTFHRSLLLRQAAQDRKGEASTLVGIAKIHHRLGNAAEALDYLNRALEIYREVKDEYAEADALSETGWVYSSTGDLKKAVESFQQALLLRRQAGDREGEATTLYGLARVQARLGNLSHSRTLIESCIGIIESLRSKGYGQHLRMSYFALVQDYFEFYIDLLMQLDNMHPGKGLAASALLVSERARARSLLDLLIESRIDIREGVSGDLLARERALQQRLNSAAERKSKAAIEGRPDEAAIEEVARLTGEYQELLASIRRESPRHAALAPQSLISVSDIQLNLLDDDSVIVEFSLGTEQSYVWAITRSQVTGRRLPARKNIEEAAQRVRQSLAARNEVRAGETARQKRARFARADTDCRREATRLSRQILRPIAGELSGKRLVIVPDGALHYIPFPALPAPRSGDEKRIRYRPLILDHEIVVLPSISALAFLRRDLKSREKALPSVAVIADPVFSLSDERVSPTGIERGAAAMQNRDQMEKHLPRLFTSRWEAEQIISLLPAGRGQLAIDFDANRTAVLGDGLSRFDIVHFATHAIIDDLHPELSAVALSSVDEKGRPREGFLRAHEIFNMKLRAELVVLNACQTGLGREVKGEGLVGLTRAFMCAGSPRVMVSLWSVNDQATAELTVRFYRKLLGTSRLSPAAALRAAQSEMFKHSRWHEPYFWAGLVLQGEWK